MRRTIGPIDPIKSLKTSELWDLLSALQSVATAKAKLGQREEAYSALQESLTVAELLNRRVPNHAQFACVLAQLRAEAGALCLALNHGDGPALLNSALELAESLIERDKHNHGFTALKVNVLRNRSLGMTAWVTHSTSSEERVNCLAEAKRSLMDAEILLSQIPVLPLRSSLRPELDEAEMKLDALSASVNDHSSR